MTARLTTTPVFENLAGTGNSEAARAELVAAGIPVVTFARYGECKVDVIGVLHGWVFDRRWYYWSASASTGSEIDTASASVVRFDDEHGARVRAHGYAGGGALSMGPSVRTFHIDTADGLLAFAEFLNSRAT